jgi:ABC-2 type transport system permease protein
MILLGNVGLSLVLFPVLLLCIMLFSVGVGLALSVYNVFYRDVNYLVTIGMNVLFYGTPIIYSIALVEKKSELLARIMEMNPIAQYVQWSRDIFYGLTMPSTTSLIVIPLASFAVFVLGLAIFNRKSRDIAQEL